MTDRLDEVETESVNWVSRRVPAIIRGVGRRVRSPAWLARAASVGLCIVSVGFVAAFVSVLGSSGRLALVTRPLPMELVLALPYLVVLFAVGTVVGSGLAWRNRYWSLAARVHQTILALLGIGFVWQLFALGFLS